MRPLIAAWGIFSTVDMHEERQDDLASLIAMGMTCRKIRKEVRAILFRCIRPYTVKDVNTVIQNKDNWAKYAKYVTFTSLGLVLRTGQLLSTWGCLSRLRVNQPLLPLDSRQSLRQEGRAGWNRPC